MDRRKFLRRAGAFSIPMLAGVPGVHAAGGNFLTSLLPPSSNRVLVLIQLIGGNDGLNTLVPTDQLSELQQVRSNVYMPATSLLPITTNLAFHSRMAGMQQLFNAGKISIVQDVGYPNQNRSHFRSTDIWTTASDSTTQLDTGWMGRHLETEFVNYPTGYPSASLPHPPAISMGSVANATCQGMVTNLSQTVEDPYDSTTLALGGNTTLPNDNYGDELGFLRTAIEQTNAYGSVIRDAANLGNNSPGVTYPSGSHLASQLKNVALLISGGLQTQIYVVSLGGFDTHSGQVDGVNTTDGQHANLLQFLSEGIAAFQADLEALGLADRVLGMTFSEFGRRIRSNGSVGTDHGTAAPQFLFGNCVSGTVLGNNPTIDTSVSQDEGVPMQYDFRDLYGSVLVDWFGVADADVRSLLYPNFVYLPVAGGCAASLPVDLLNFTATGRDKRVELEWQTSFESENAGFEVERSTDGRNFRPIGFVAAREADARGYRDYAFTDADVVEGPTYYYRLKQKDFDGGFEYSPIRTARLLGTAVGEWSVGTPQPNPATSQTTVQVFAPVDGRVTYALYDASGRKLFGDSTAVAGRRDTRIDVPLGRVPAGIYTLRFRAGGGDFVNRKLVVSK